MIKSMTGFGSATAVEEGREYTVELKAVNHKFLDLNFRMPRCVGFSEDALRRVISANVARGHLEVGVSYRNSRSDSKQVAIDTALAEQFMATGRQLAANCGIDFDLKINDLLRMPNVVDVIEGAEDADAVIELAMRACGSALLTLSEMRIREGQRLRDDLCGKLDNLAGLREKIAERAPLVARSYECRLRERVTSALADAAIAQDRLLTEVAIFAEKVCIDEELVRISGHIAAFRELLELSEPVGRRMDFLSQELNREFNTIGSKANDAQIAAYVIDGKSELEKIREQVQNIE